MPDFTHQRHVQVANIVHHILYGRELMHLGLQSMAYRAYISHKYSLEITDREWDKLDGTHSSPEAFADLPGRVCGTE